MLAKRLPNFRAAFTEKGDRQIDEFRGIRRRRRGEVSVEKWDSVGTLKELVDNDDATKTMKPDCVEGMKVATMEDLLVN